jgi:hypothetical protein
MEKRLTGFPLSLIGLAIVLAFGLVWAEHPNVVIGDISAMAAGLSLALVLMSYAAFAFSRHANRQTLEPERAERARRVAWIALTVIVVIRASSIFVT